MQANDDFLGFNRLKWVKCHTDVIWPVIEIIDALSFHLFYKQWNVIYSATARILFHLFHFVWVIVVVITRFRGRDWLTFVITLCLMLPGEFFQSLRVLGFPQKSAWGWECGKFENYWNLCCFLDLGTCVDMSHHRSSTQTAVVRNNKWLGYSPHCLFTLAGQDKARWDSSQRLWNTNDIRWSDYERLHWNGQISLCDHIFPLPWKWFSLARSKW